MKLKGGRWTEVEAVNLDRLVEEMKLKGRRWTEVEAANLDRLVEEIFLKCHLCRNLNE